MSLLKKIRQIRLCLPTFPPRRLCLSPRCISTQKPLQSVIILFFSAQQWRNVVALFPRLYRRGQFEQLTSLLISICERKETFSHSSSSWRAYYWHFIWIHPDWRIRDHSPLVSERWECSANLAQQGHIMMKHGLSFFLSQVRGDIKKRGKPVSEAWTQQDGSPAWREIKAVEVDVEAEG